MAANNIYSRDEVYVQPSRKGYTSNTSLKLPALHTKKYDRVVEAYAILGVDPNEVIRTHKITPLLAKLDGGLPAALNYLRASPSPAARQFLSRYDDPTVPMCCRTLLPLEAFCLAAKVEPSRILGAIMEVAHLQGVALASIIAANAHPEIVRTSTRLAQLPDGVSDREWNLKHMGFLPTPKGSQVNVQVNANASAQSASQSAVVDAPSPEQTIRRMVSRFNESRSVPALPATIDAETIPRTMEPAKEPIPANYVTRTSDNSYADADADASDDE